MNRIVTSTICTSLNISSFFKDRHPDHYLNRLISCVLLIVNLDTEIQKTGPKFSEVLKQIILALISVVLI